MRTRAGSAQTSLGDAPASAWALKIRPSPTESQGTRCGIGVHGAWLEISAVSTIAGASMLARRRWMAARVYWSGIVTQLNGLPA